MNSDPSFFLPAQRSTLAPGVDGLFDFIGWMSLILFVMIVGAALYFVWKYRRKPGDELKLSTPTFHSVSLELFWSVGPLLACIGLFHVGVKQYMFARVAPGDALEVRVRAHQWAWEFEYPSGKISDELHAPVNKPVKLIMTSQDVIHSFYVPDFRIKQDVLPGRYSMVWFQANHTGEDRVFCAEYCGLSHSNMMAKVIVETDEDYDKWINFDPYATLPLAEVGAKLYNDKACSTCHSIDGSARVGGGPSWKGLYGRTEQIIGGPPVVADDAYIKESILVPAAKIVVGYQPIMPSFQGSLKERQIQGIIEYIKTLK